LYELYNNCLFLESTLNAKDRKELDDKDFGLPNERNYPLIDEEHIKKAIQFFKYCPEEKRKELAKNIYKKAKKFNVKINDDSLINKYL